MLAGGLQAERGLILGRVSNAARPTLGQALHWLLSPRVPAEWAVRSLAACFGSRRASGDFVRIQDYVHLATFAPAGGGKSVSVLYPNLLSFQGNLVVIDPKGELYRTTHQHRQREFGHTIASSGSGWAVWPGCRLLQSVVCQPKWHRALVRDQPPPGVR